MQPAVSGEVNYKTFQKGTMAIFNENIFLVNGTAPFSIVKKLAIHH